MIAKPKNKITAGKKSPKIPKEISFSPKLFTKILLGVVIFLLPFGLLTLLKEIKVGPYSFAFQTGYVNSQSAGEIAKKFIGEQIIGGEVKVAKVTDEGITQFRPVAGGRHRYLVVNSGQVTRITEAFVQLCSQPPTKKPQP